MAPTTTMLPRAGQVQGRTVPRVSRRSCREHASQYVWIRPALGPPRKPFISVFIAKALASDSLKPSNGPRAVLRSVLPGDHECTLRVLFMQNGGAAQCGACMQGLPHGPCGTASAARNVLLQLAADGFAVVVAIAIAQQHNGQQAGWRLQVAGIRCSLVVTTGTECNPGRAWAGAGCLVKLIWTAVEQHAMTDLQGVWNRICRQAL